MIFQVEGQGDRLFIKAESVTAVRQRLDDMFGFIPEDLYTIFTVAEVPDGEELL